MDFSVDYLHASATKITGLDDFGDPDYVEGLSILVDSLLGEAELTEQGAKVQRATLRGILMARLFSESGFKANPAHAEVAIERPIFVLGLPRTGTTALHRLLVADPAHQGMEVWLGEVPQPRPPRAEWADNPVYAALQAGYAQHHLDHPEFMGVHFLSADMVEECWYLLRQSMLSTSFECLAHIPSFSRWLSEQDGVAAFRRHRRNLQLIGLNDQDKRWVLKYPSHIFHLDALLAVYPDALIIQTHRSPRTAVASACSLNAQASAGWSTLYQGSVLGQDQLDLWARGYAAFASARARHDPRHFVDVQYADFVASPMSVVDEIYARLGTPLSDPARSAMTALTSSEGGSTAHRPSHQYRLEDFGLSEADIDARFP